MPNSKDAGVLQALNGPAFGGPAVERIGWTLTATGPALNVAITGAPIVISINLDLADDEVAIGGPTKGGGGPGGLRQLFRGVDNGDGTNAIEVVDQGGATGDQAQIAVPAVGVQIVPANDARREIIVCNTGAVAMDLFLNSILGAFGSGFRLVAPLGGAQFPITLRFKGEILARVAAAAGTLSYMEVLD